MNNNTTGGVTLATVQLAWFDLRAARAERRFFEAMRLGDKPCVGEARFRFWMWKTVNAAALGQPLPPMREPPSKGLEP